MSLRRVNELEYHVALSRGPDGENVLCACVRVARAQKKRKKTQQDTELRNKTNNKKNYETQKTRRVSYYTMCTKTKCHGVDKKIPTKTKKRIPGM